MNKVETLTKEITKLVEIIYDSKKLSTESIIKMSIQRFLIANYYVQLADDQKLPEMDWSYYGHGDESHTCMAVQQEMIRTGWRKIVKELGIYQEEVEK